jgi:hypothetical protein
VTQILLNCSHLSNLKFDNIYEIPTEHKAAASILRTISKESQELKKVDLEKLLTPPAVKNIP